MGATGMRQPKFVGMPQREFMAEHGWSWLTQSVYPELVARDPWTHLGPKLPDEFEGGEQDEPTRVR